MQTGDPVTQATPDILPSQIILAQPRASEDPSGKNVDLLPLILYGTARDPWKSSRTIDEVLVIFGHFVNTTALPYTGGQRIG